MTVISVTVTPDFKPPLANFELEETKAPSAGTAGPSGGKKGRKPGGKGYADESVLELLMFTFELYTLVC